MAIAAERNDRSQHDHRRGNTPLREPISIYVGLPADKEAQASTEPKHGDDPPKWTDQIVAYSAIGTALLTLILAISTFMLWLSTRRLWQGAEEQHTTLKASVEEARLAGVAAKQSSDSYRAVESAYITFADDVKFSKTDFLEDGETHNGSEFLAQFRNTGRTPANISLMVADKIIVKKPYDLKDIKFPTEIPTGIGIGMKLGPNTQTGIGPVYVKEKDMESFRQGSSSIFIRYIIKYSTIFDPKPQQEEIWLLLQYGGIVSQGGRVIGERIGWGPIPPNG